MQLPTRTALDAADENTERWRRARDGDMAAFEQLYRKHVGRVYAVCLRLAGNRTLAEECTQDAFVRAWESLAKFRGDSSFGTWVHRIAVNTVLERHRTQLRQAAWVTTKSDEILEAVPAEESDRGTASIWNSASRSCRLRHAWCSYCSTWRAVPTKRSPR